jgi:hypothetical protein
MQISRRRRLAFACVAILLSIVGSVAALLALDLYAHHRVERTAGLNIWGYRGPIVGAKRPGEVRIAFLGGSTMFGYGVSAAEAIPAVVEQTLQRSWADLPPVSAVNLAYNGEGAYAFAFVLEDFGFLDYDLVVLYEGYNDLMGDPRGPNTMVFRQQSAIFRLTGYYPILPLVLREKAMALRAGGDLAAAYDGERVGKTVFRPSMVERTSAAALDAATLVSESLGRQLGRFVEAPSGRIEPSRAGCAYPWGEYCQSVYDAITHARARGAQVVVVSQPRAREPVAQRHREQQDALRDMVARHFRGDGAVHYVDMSDAVDLSDPALCYDGMHLTPAGNRQLGGALAEVLVPLVRAASQPRA